MQCFPFYSPNKFNPIGRIPPSRTIYEGIPIDPLVPIKYKNNVLDSINVNTYTQNQLYSYASVNSLRYSCLVSTLNK